VNSAFSFRRFGYAVAAMAVVLAIGTLGFHAALSESWLQSFYRAVVSSSLTGLDTVPKNDSARILTIFLVLAGISIFAYIGSLVVEAIARGVIGGMWAERRRRRAIEDLHDHYII
jgi:voltage-gated potassium channel